ncbi:hemagglutinin repeat-containing protein [Veillonella caviae]|uniref:hemagglutinin repeat-containing protein n=1 Tax=Veillonella caviae TaxID=248316 RepID=UPI0023F98E2B|nr:hemagglutinin repeat-containing protein [Veillonella caviae]
MKGNIKVVGEEIHGRQVTLEATNDIDLQAATNTLRTESSSTASGWGLSANIGLRTGNIVGSSASVYKATEHGIETGSTHTGTHMVADDALHITSGKDTNLIGSTATGAFVKANVGSNVTIESLQDTNSYDETSRHTGISVSTADMTHFGVSGANVKGHIDSDYKSVTQQAGIHAGAKGIDITVGDTTTLKGAIITSTATPDNNKLSTKQLITEDIQNEASYNAKQSGVSMNTSGLTGKGILGKINPLGLSTVVTIPVSDSASSTTRSAISENIILDVENKSAVDINRDTEHALNSIKPIFDKDDVKERLAYVNAVSAEGFKLIGDISLKQQLKYEAKARNEDNIELKTKYLSEAQQWSEGGAYKVALHGAFGAYLGDLSGGSAVKGFTVGASNEYLNKMLDSHRDANLHKWFSTIVEHAVDRSMGSAMALSATTHNWITHGEQVNLKYDLAAYKDNPGMIVKKLAYYDSLMDFEHEYNSVYKTSNYLTQDLYDYLLARCND